MFPTLSQTSMGKALHRSACTLFTSWCFDSPQRSAKRCTCVSTAKDGTYSSFQATSNTPH